jgi:cell division cycle 20, cofactor of APC complex
MRSVAPVATPYLHRRELYNIQYYGLWFENGTVAMDMDMAHYLLTKPRKGKENPAASPAMGAYGKLLAEKLLNNHTRILAFRNKPFEPENILADLHAHAASFQARPTKQRRHIPQVCTGSCSPLSYRG